MKLTIPKSSLSAELSAISSVVKTRNVLPILACAKLETAGVGFDATITATNLDCTYRRIIDPSVISEVGSCLLPVARVKEWLGIVGDGDVTIESEGQKLKLSVPDCGQQRFAVEKVEDFPVMPVGEEKRIATADFAALKDISWSIITGDRATARPALEAVFFERAEGGLLAATTNGYCLGTLRLPAEIFDESFKELALPSGCLDLVASLGKCELSETQNALVFSTPSRRLSVRKSEYPIPNWKSAINQYPFTGSASVVREELATAVALCHLYRGSDRGVRVEMEMVEGGMKISCEAHHAPEGSERVIMCRVDGEVPKIAFNSEFLMPFFSLEDDSLLKLEFSGDQTVSRMSAGDVVYYFLPLHRRKVSVDSKTDPTHSGPGLESAVKANDK